MIAPVPAAQQLSLPWWEPEAAAAPTLPLGTAPAIPPTEPDAATPAAVQPFNMTPVMQAQQTTPTTPAHQPPNASAPSGLAVFRHPHAHHEIRLGNALVAFELKRLRRKSIGMVVGADGLSVRAPRWVGWGEIEQALQAKSRWICTKLAEQRERNQRQQAAQIEWREGAMVPYLGEQVILVLDPRVSGAQLNDDAQALPGVARKTLHVGLPQHAGAEQIRDVVTAWLQREARAIFLRRVQHFSGQLGVSVSSIRLSSARTRWGSASADGSVRLHWRLIHFSAAVIDYVVAHELAHLREMNHSPRFWGVVASVMPEYDAVREQLRHAVIPD